MEGFTEAVTFTNNSMEDNTTTTTTANTTDMTTTFTTTDDYNDTVVTTEAITMTTPVTTVITETTEAQTGLPISMELIYGLAAAGGVILILVIVLAVLGKRGQLKCHKKPQRRSSMSMMPHPDEGKMAQKEPDVAEAPGRPRNTYTPTPSRHFNDAQQEGDYADADLEGQPVGVAQTQAEAEGRQDEQETYANYEGPSSPQLMTGGNRDSDDGGQENYANFAQFTGQGPQQKGQTPTNDEQEAYTAMEMTSNTTNGQELYEGMHLEGTDTDRAAHPGKQEDDINVMEPYLDMHGSAGKTPTEPEPTDDGDQELYRNVLSPGHATKAHPTRGLHRGNAVDNDDDAQELYVNTLSIRRVEGTANTEQKLPGQAKRTEGERQGAADHHDNSTARTQWPDKVEEDEKQQDLYGNMSSVRDLRQQGVQPPQDDKDDKFVPHNVTTRHPYANLAALGN